MSPLSTTIVLDRTLNHSITFNPSDDSLTANLPNPSPIEKVANKPKLMLLIYLVQRDLHRKTLPHKINAEAAFEMRIVERIISQFSNYTQALRTLKEYTEVGDRNDTSRGLAPSKLDRDVPGRRSRPIKMVITKEAKDVLRGWLRETLTQETVQKQKSEKSNGTTKSSGSSKRRNTEVIDLSSPPPETLSEDELQIIQRPTQKRKRQTSGETGVLTPGSPTRPTIQSHPPSSASDNFYQLFPSSPLGLPQSETIPVQPSPIKSIVTIEDTPRPSSSAGSPSEEDSSDTKDVKDAGDSKDTEDDSDEKRMMDLESFVDKIALYSKKAYLKARSVGGKNGVKKYTRKLRRLTTQFQESHTNMS